jgi:hypothetical protein
MITKAVFIWLLLTGQVEYQQNGGDGRKQYALFFEDGTVVDYAYKAEILEYIETGTFEYDDTLDDKVTDAHKGK